MAPGWKPPASSISMSGSWPRAPSASTGVWMSLHCSRGIAARGSLSRSRQVSRAEESASSTGG